MDLAANKKTARDFLEASCTGDLEQMRDLTTDDFTWWQFPSTQFGGTHQKAEFFDMLAGAFADVEGPSWIDYGDFTAEEDRVSVTAQGHMKLKGGRIYDSHYHLLFYFRDGKICAGREYLDTALVNRIFG